jgi:hypothetical protein
LIYAIFICNALAGSCQQALSQLFETPQECVAAMIQYYATPAPTGDPPAGKLVGKRVYSSKYQWFECEGRQTWQPVE